MPDPQSEPPQVQLVARPEFGTEQDWSFLDVLFDAPRGQQIWEMRRGEPDDEPCAPTVRTAGVFRGPGVTILAKTVNGALTVFATGGIIAFPLGLVGGDVAKWALTSDEQRTGRRLGMPIRADIAAVVEAVDVVMCAQEGRLDRCRVVRDWGVRSYEDALNWSAELFAVWFGAKPDAGLVTWLLSRQSRVRYQS